MNDNRKRGYPFEHPRTQCDSEGIRTLDPQLRRLLLYPTELLNHPFLRGQKYIFLMTTPKKINTFYML